MRRFPCSLGSSPCSRLPNKMLQLTQPSVAHLGRGTVWRRKLMRQRESGSAGLRS